MAGQSDKKNHALANYWRQIMQIGLLSVNVLYVAMWLCFNEAERGYFWTDALWLLLYSFVTKFCYESINDMNERGIRPDK